MSTISVNSITAKTANSDLTLTGNGTGKVVLGDGNLIFPDADGSADQLIKTDGSGNLSFVDAAGGGKVIQIVTATTATAVSSNSTTRADTTLTASITPANSANKILVIISQHCSAGGGRADGDIILMRDSTDLINYSQQANVDNGMGNYFFPYLDSPSTTSSTTYKTQQARVDQSGIFRTQVTHSSGQAQSYITLIEMDYS